MNNYSDDELLTLEDSLQTTIDIMGPGPAANPEMRASLELSLKPYRKFLEAVRAEIKRRAITANEPVAEPEMKELDEKGFVFIGADGNPYLCRMWGDAAWLFWWHPDDHWVSMSQVAQMDIWTMPRNLTPEQQQMYHDLHDKWMYPFIREINRGQD